jgi:release factor glutamine methyltransferase
MTMAEAITRAREALVAAGVPAEEAPGDAEVLARHVLGWDMAKLAASRRDQAPAAFQEQYDALVARRTRREPVSQIVGHREFWGLDFEVTRDVLTPRPETEILVDAALDVAPRDRPIVILDVGTGSGCIAIALATELPNARVVASDASIAALTVARRNAARHGVAQRIAFLHSALAAPENDVELLVSNPPYIPLPDAERLPPEVRDYEPSMALFGGEDGLDMYRALFRGASNSVTAAGRVIVEVGYDQAQVVREIAEREGWMLETVNKDLQGIPRTLVFHRPSSPEP